MNRKTIADIILDKLLSKKDELSLQFKRTSGKIGFFVLQDVLPNDIALMASDAFPKTDKLSLKKSLKEYKYVSAQMDNYDSILEEILYAFQDSRIVKLVQEICRFEVNIFPDVNLYAGGISVMNTGCFLNPHLDNSHDLSRKSWRVLNLLYYASPNWKLENGGNLELWPNGIKSNPIELLSEFNSLVVMETHNESWHSVNQIKSANPRLCISNYYFSNEPMNRHKNFHVTSFRGRPNQFFRDFVLNLDTRLRMSVRKIFKKGIRENPHVYKRK